MVDRVIGWCRLLTAVKVGANRRAQPTRGGTFLSTQTRVLATHARTRRVFAAYWLVVRPLSGLIRRSWPGAWLGDSQTASTCLVGTTTVLTNALFFYCALGRPP